jgi:basic membrane protein A
MKKISILLLVLFAALALVLTGCGQDEVVADQPAEDAEAAEAEADPMIAAMATDVGEQGADIIFHAAGLTGLGAIQAAKDAGILAIGVDVDQNNVAPDTVLTSAIKKIPESVYVVLESVANDNFEGGTKSYGLAEDATGIAPFHGFDDVVPQEVKDAVATAREDILSGEIEVATTRAEIEDLLD